MTTNSGKPEAPIRETTRFGRSDFASESFRDRWTHPSIVTIVSRAVGQFTGDLVRGSFEKNSLVCIHLVSSSAGSSRLGALITAWRGVFPEELAVCWAWWTVAVFVVAVRSSSVWAATLPALPSSDRATRTAIRIRIVCMLFLTNSGDGGRVSYVLATRVPPSVANTQQRGESDLLGHGRCNPKNSIPVEWVTSPCRQRSVTPVLRPSPLRGHRFGYSTKS